MSAFLEWAKASLVALTTVSPGHPSDDLKPVGAMIGGAEIVGLSEAVHGGRELLEFRNRLFQYLVEEKKFTAIAIEAGGIVESRVIHDYVRDGVGNVDSALEKGLSFGFELQPENRILVEWMRQYNADSSHHRKINFYGVDVAGAWATRHPYFSHDVPVSEALRYLSQVDAPAARIFTGRLQRLLSVRFHPRQHIKNSYCSLSRAERDAFTAAIADLVSWFERHQIEYTQASSRDDYAWAYQAAVAVRQTDNMLRPCPSGWTPSKFEQTEADELSSFHFVTGDVRDRAWAENIDWILEQEGEGAKVLLYGALVHISAAPVRTSWPPHHNIRDQRPAGAYLRDRFGERFIAIGNLVGEMAAGFGLGSPPYVLDLRKALLPVRQELASEQALNLDGMVIRTSLAQAFDLLLYMDKVSPNAL